MFLFSSFFPPSFQRVWNIWRKSSSTSVSTSRTHVWRSWAPSRISKRACTWWRWCHVETWPIKASSLCTDCGEVQENLCINDKHSPGLIISCITSTQESGVSVSQWSSRDQGQTKHHWKAEDRTPTVGHSTGLRLTEMPLPLDWNFGLLKTFSGREEAHEGHVDHEVLSVAKRCDFSLWSFKFKEKSAPVFFWVEQTISLLYS